MVRSAYFVTSFQWLLLSCCECFTSPSAGSFLALGTAWILSVGPRTVTNLVRMLGPCAPKSHDAYQYFFSGAAWVMEDLWKVLFQLILNSGLIPADAVVELAGDDTLVHHSGRRIFGVGMFRDAVRSSRKHVAYACGHNWVILCVIVAVPFCPGVFVTLPVCARLRPKPAEGQKKSRRGAATTVELLEEMLAQVAGWAPQRRFLLVADGAYACLAGDLPQNVNLVSRLRKDAALYGSPPRRKEGQRGRPRKKGDRLPTPKTRAKAPSLSWESKTLTLYAEGRELRLHSYQAYWYDVCPDRPISIVIVRDPTGAHPDEYFFTTDLTMSPEAIVLAYGHRWGQEVTHREAKQQMGIADPQARVRQAVERQVPFGLVLLSLVKLWYLTRGHREDGLAGWRDAWYVHKEGVAFTDMLGALRFAAWQNWFSKGLGFGHRERKSLRPLLRALSRAS